MMLEIESLFRSPQTGLIRNNIFFCILCSGRNLPRLCTHRPLQNGQLTFPMPGETGKGNLPGKNITAIQHSASLQFRMHHFHLDQGWGRESANTWFESGVLEQWPWMEPDSPHWQVARVWFPRTFFISSQMDEGNLFNAISRLYLIISTLLEAMY